MKPNLVHLLGWRSVRAPLTAAERFTGAQLTVNAPHFSVLMEGLMKQGVRNELES